MHTPLFSKVALSLHRDRGKSDVQSCVCRECGLKRCFITRIIKSTLDGNSWSASRSGRSALPPGGKSSRCSLSRRTRGSQSMSERFGEKTAFLLPGREQRFFVSRSLYGLHYLDSVMATKTNGHVTRTGNVHSADLVVKQPDHRLSQCRFFRHTKGRRSQTCSLVSSTKQLTANMILVSCRGQLLIDVMHRYRVVSTHWIELAQNCAGRGL